MLDALLDCFQNMAFLCKADTLHLPRFGGWVLPCSRLFEIEILTPPTAGSPLYFPAPWLMSKSQPPRRRDCFQNTSVRRGNTFHVTCSGGARTALLSFASAFRSPRFSRHRQQKPRRISRFCGSVHEPTTKTPCSVSSEQSGICQWCCPHSQHHQIGHFDEKMVCGCGKTKATSLPLVEQTRKTRISKRIGASKDETEFWMPSLPWRCIE
jgi:hypothetical protein